MNIVCLDTHFVIWGVKKEASQGQEENINKVSLLLDELEKAKTKIIIPAIVVGEVLVGTLPEKRSAFLQQLYKRFMIPPFDAFSALVFSEMYTKWLDKRSVESEENKPIREKMKADCLIVAVAVTAKAECIYTHDGGLKNYAEGYITVKTLEDIAPPPQQMGLF